MDCLDLDLDNYTLDDLLALFKLDYNFNKEELGLAYRMVLKTHPDKCDLDRNIFIFLMNAYKMVERVYKFRKGKNEKNTEYIVDEKDIDKGLLIEKLNGMKVSDFNKWFNKMFDKHKLDDEEGDGYDEWYRNTEEKDVKQVTKNEFDEIFYKKKRESRALVKHRDVETDLETDGIGHNLLGEKPEYYSSRIFSKLQYDDLKRAHTETVVPVTREDYDNRLKFNSVDSYQRHRATQLNDSRTPSALRQAEEYLNQKKKATEEYDARRAFKILKRDEEIEKKNKEWWSELNLLKN
jgi:hypothetical protein